MELLSWCFVKYRDDIEEAYICTKFTFCILEHFCSFIMYENQ